MASSFGCIVAAMMEGSAKFINQIRNIEITIPALLAESIPNKNNAIELLIPRSAIAILGSSVMAAK